MALPETASGEQDVIRFVQNIAEICFSEEFNSLREELEFTYFNAKVDNAFITAFQDALFAILAQNNSVLMPMANRK